MFLVRHKAKRRTKSASLLVLLLATLAGASNVLSDDANSVTIRYELPEFGMKLIVLDEDDVKESEIQQHLDAAVVAHLNEFVAKALPDKTGGFLNQETFRNIVIDSLIEKTQIEVEQEDDIKLSVIRAGFEGVANFVYEKELAAAASLLQEEVQLPVHIYRYIKDAFKQHDGFWDFAEYITNDDVLSRTGKLQIAVGTIIVGEGSLVGEEDDEDDMSTLAIVVVCVAAAILAFCIVTAIFLLRRRCRERSLERQKLRRRESAKKRRQSLLEDHSHGSGNDTTTMSHSSAGMEEHNHWLDAKTKSISKISNRLVVKKSSGRVRSRPAMEARKSSDKLLHCIVEESSNHDDTSRRSVNDRKTMDDIENVFGGIVENSVTSIGSNLNSNSLPTMQSGSGSIGSQINMSHLMSTDGSVEDGYYYTNSSVTSSSNNESFSNDGIANITYDGGSFNANRFNNSLNDSSDPQDVFGMMNQEGFDTLNPDEFDFDLGGSNDLSMSEEEGGGSLNCSMNLGDFGDDFIPSPDDDYELRIDPHLTFT